MEEKGHTLLLDHQLCFPLYAASRMVTRLYQPLLKDMGITYPQYLVLLLLWEKDNQKVGDIGKALELNTNTLTPLLKKMEEKGMLIRNRSSEDERVVLAQLTPKGKAMKQKAECIPQELLHQLNMDKSDLQTLRDLLKKLMTEGKSHQTSPENQTLK